MCMASTNFLASASSVLGVRWDDSLRRRFWFELDFLVLLRRLNRDASNSKFLVFNDFNNLDMSLLLDRRAVAPVDPSRFVRSRHEPDLRLIVGEDGLASILLRRSAASEFLLLDGPLVWGGAPSSIASISRTEVGLSLVMGLSLSGRFASLLSTGIRR